VRLAGGEEVSAAHVVSNSSLPTTYAMVDDPSLLPPGLRRELGTRRIGISAFVLYMGLSATPAELGLTTSTSFVTADLDTDRTFASSRTLEPARAVGITSYDVAPIGFAPSGSTHVSLLTLQYADVWQQLAPREYADAKFAYAETLLDLVENLTPDIRDAIEEADVGTPLTMMRYLGHPGGAIYGYDQEAADGWLFRTGEAVFGDSAGGEPTVPGLYAAGAWAGMGGFQPTLQAGAKTARRVLDVA
jgi:prolycopene isomerase